MLAYSSSAGKEFYSVTRGRRKGVFSSRDEAACQVEDYPGGCLKTFRFRDEAVADYMSDASKPCQELDGRSIIYRLGCMDEVEVRDVTLVNATHIFAVARDHGYSVVLPNYEYLDYSSKSDPSTHLLDREELSAILHCARISKVIDLTDQKPLVIHTDSCLLVQTMTCWMQAWSANMWVKSDSSEIPNVDLIKAINAALGNRRATYIAPIKPSISTWQNFWFQEAIKLASAESKEPQFSLEKSLNPRWWFYFFARPENGKAFLPVIFSHGSNLYSSVVIE